MRRNALRALALLVLAGSLSGCDKCADYYIVNPFATKPAGTCQTTEPARR